MFLSGKIRRTGAFNDRRLQQQVDEIIDKTNDAIEGIEQTIEIVQDHPNLPKPDFDPPGIPILRVVPAFRTMVCLIDRMPDYDFSHFDIQRSTSSDGQITWSEWETIWSGTDMLYADVGLDLNTDYRYRARSWDIWDNPSDYCEPVIGGKPGKVSLSEEVVGELADEFVAGSDLWNQTAEDLTSVRAGVEGNTADISVLAQKTDEISTTVAKHERTALLESTITSYNATTQQVTDTSQNFTTLTTDDGQTLLASLKGFMIAMLDGNAKGEVRTVVAHSQNTLTLDSAFSKAPSVGDPYRLAHPSLVASSTLQQQADAIEARVMATDDNGQPIPNAILRIGQVDGSGYILMKADDIIIDGTIHAKHFAEIRNVWQVGDVDAIAQGKPVEFDFWLPSEMVGLESVRLYAQAMPFRAYAATAESGGSHTHTVDIPGHKHDMPSGITQQNATTSTSSEVTVTDPGHSHGGGTLGTSYDSPGSSCGTAGSHTHDVFGSTTTDEGHNHAIDGFTDQTGGHSHSITGGSHSHSVSGTTDTSKANVSVSLKDHKHIYTYWAPGDASVTSTSGASKETSSSSGGHTHPLNYGIFEDTTPAGVKVYCNNGSGYGTAIALNSAPTNPKAAYELTPAGGLDLTSRFSNPGHKRIKFESTRLGRINFQIFIKADLTA